MLVAGAAPAGEGSVGFHTNTLIVTHKTKLQEAFGREWVDINEGECRLSAAADSASPPVARIAAGEWIAIAQAR